jgi:hypothetical protein
VWQPFLEYLICELAEKFFELFDKWMSQHLLSLPKESLIQLFYDIHFLFLVLFSRKDPEAVKNWLEIQQLFQAPLQFPPTPSPSSHGDSEPHLDSILSFSKKLNGLFHSIEQQVILFAALSTTHLFFFFLSFSDGSN